MSLPVERSDFLVIGAGVLGLAVAREILLRRPQASVTVLEKESEIATHASGRNSGVLHAGFYYSADSLKARFTAEGNRRMKEFCAEKSIPVDPCGKLVVPRSPAELETLHQLQQRGKAQGIDVSLLSAEQAAKIEPNARFFREALSSPSTAVVDPRAVCRALREDVVARGGKVITGAPFQQRLNGNLLLAGDRLFQGEKLVSAAGLYADKIARAFGFCSDYTILPFKGVYLKRKSPGRCVATNIYPVPNLKNPFLGVHFTMTRDGSDKIGPTAMPAFWRENYSGMAGFSWRELWQICGLEAGLLMRNDFNFRDLALEEIKKYSMSYLLREAGELVHQMPDPSVWQWGPAGIRAQLLHLPSRSLAKDFIVEGDQKSVHVLNAVSPAFTSALPFAKHLVETHCLG